MKITALLGSIVLTALSAVVLYGCGNKAPDTASGSATPTTRQSDSSGVGGMWKGDGSTATDPSAKSMYEAMSLDLKPDKSFSASMGIPMEGTWSSNGNTVTLKLSKIAGSSIADMHKMAAQDPSSKDDFDNPIVLEMSADGKTLAVTQMQTGKPLQPTVFKR